jgi:hypothetical protein
LLVQLEYGEGESVLCSGNSLICTLAMSLALAGSAYSYSGGTGEPNTPYQIATVADWDTLIATQADWVAGKYFVQIADIDFAGVSKSAIGYYNGTTNHGFNASYNGQGYKLSNAVPTRHASDPYNIYAIFGCVGTGSISNVVVENCIIDANSSAKNRPSMVALLAGFCVTTNVRITNCHVSGTIAFTHATPSIEYSFVGLLVGLCRGGYGMLIRWLYHVLWDRCGRLQ